jgi:ferredoxin, 2Fe-2S
MPKITYVHADGAREELEAAEGTSVMQAATAEGVEGIVAECGGNCMCATCHVYVEPSQLALLPAMSEDEDALLDGTASERRPNSRLSCQIEVTPALDGLVVNLPERQV